jgi:hypothetical protein
MIAGEKHALFMIAFLGILIYNATYARISSIRFQYMKSWLNREICGRVLLLGMRENKSL